MIGLPRDEILIRTNSDTHETINYKAPLSITTEPDIHSVDINDHEDYRDGDFDQHQDQDSDYTF